jgi:hypothetical protein
MLKKRKEQSVQMHTCAFGGLPKEKGTRQKKGKGGGENEKRIRERNM